MGGKILILLALLVSAGFIYFCVDSKKEELYATLNPSSIPPVVEEGIVLLEVNKTLIRPVAQNQNTPIMIEKKPPSFAYISGDKEKFAGFLSEEDKNASIIMEIDKICEPENCIKNIKFFEDVIPFTFTEDTLGLIAYAKKENIKEFALFIDKNSVKIEGELKTQEQKEMIKPFLDAYINQGYALEDKMQAENLVPLVKEEIIKEELIIEDIYQPLVTPNHLNIEDASSQINSILRANPISFDYKSTSISQVSQETLNGVIDILLELEKTIITVAGYTDSKGGEIYNKVLSQKRADAVRAYLVKSGVRRQLIKSVGYGEENPIGSPEDSINRRVEIHLSEGTE